MFIALIMAIVSLVVSVVSSVLFFVFRKKSPWSYFLLILAILALIPVGFWIYQTVTFSLTDL